MAESSSMPKVKIVFMEGVHGVGKTTMLNELEERGYYVVPEGFELGDEEVEDYLTEHAEGHNFACELQWVGQMFRRLYEAIVRFQMGKLKLKDNYIFVDRSWVTAMIYGLVTDVHAAESYVQLSKMICSQLEALGAELMIIYLRRPDAEEHWCKIKERLVSEPYRQRLKEGNRGWLEACRRRYAIMEKTVHMLRYDLTDHYNGRVKRTVTEFLRFIDTAFLLRSWVE